MPLHAAAELARRCRDSTVFVVAWPLTRALGCGAVVLCLAPRLALQQTDAPEGGALCVVEGGRLLSIWADTARGDQCCAVCNSKVQEGGVLSAVGDARLLLLLPDKLQRALESD